MSKIAAAWDAIPLEEKDSFSALTAFAMKEDGDILEAWLLEQELVTVSWNELVEKHGVSSDMLFCVRLQLLKENLFPEVDLYMPESVVWTAIGCYNTRLILEPLLIKEYKSDHAISFSGVMSYNRGRAYSLAYSVRNLSSYKRPFHIRLWRLITFIRCALHGELSLFGALQLWGKNSSLVLFCSAVAPAVLLVIKDNIQRKVRFTHREFEENKDLAEIRCVRYEIRGMVE